MVISRLYKKPHSVQYKKNMLQTSFAVVAVTLFVAVSASSMDDLEYCDGDDCHEIIVESNKISDEAIEVVGDIDESLNELEQDDPKLIEAIKEKYLVPPSKEPYNFTNNANVDMSGEILLTGHTFISKNHCQVYGRVDC